MKKYLIPLLCVLTATAVVFIILNEHIYQARQAPAEVVSPADDSTLTGYVTEVDTAATLVDGPAKITLLTSAGEMATVLLPSMGLPLCAAKDALAAVDDISVGDSIQVRGTLSEEGTVPCTSATHYVRVFREVSEWGTGLEFSYLVAPEGYTLETFREKISVDPDFLEGYILTRTSDLVDGGELTAPREGAPTIQIRVYKNSQAETALDWARSHPLESNIELAMGEPRAVMIEHVPAMLFKADGLYASDVYVAVHDDFVYVFTGAYSDETASLTADLAELLTTVVFLEGVTAGAAPVVTAGEVTLTIGQTGVIGGLEITPQALLEDSRCPSDVLCIQAGTVRLRALLVSGLGTAEAEFELGVPITTEAEEVVLTTVAPDTHSEDEISGSEYRFTFSVTPRP